MLQKQSVNINFAQGLDTKTDPWQVAAGRFLSLENSIFLKGGLLQKRNGFGSLPALPQAVSYLTTFNNDLTGIGSNFYAYSSSSGTWINQGGITPCGLSVVPLIRNSLNQTAVDVAVHPNGLVCTAYAELNNATTVYKYTIADSITGQTIVTPTQITAADATYGKPRVFVLGQYFILLFIRNQGGAYYLQYISISAANPSLVTAATNFSGQPTTPATTQAFDAAVLNNTLYAAFNGAAASGIKMASLTSSLTLSATVTRDAAHAATHISMAADSGGQHVWVSYYNSATSNGYNLMVDPQLNAQLAATQIISATSVKNLTNLPANGINVTYFEVINAYGFNGAIPSNYIKKINCTDAGVVSGLAIVARSVGLASKAFQYGGADYFLAVYVSPFPSTYFLLNQSGLVIARLAYQNGDGYIATGLPGVTLNGSSASVGYVLKTTIQAINKGTNLASSVPVNPVYSQRGANLAVFEFAPSLKSAEIGQNLNITGGFLWAYDGTSPVEQNFFLYPDSVQGSMNPNSVGGTMHSDATYYYQVTYEWTDNQGNTFRSAPSLPVKIAPNGNTDTGAVTLYIPTLRLTYKTDPIRICVYRWSSQQSTYYQTGVNYITAPTLNDPSVDYVTFVDTQPNTGASGILGNNILYTTGGVVEDIGPPSFKNVFLFDDRLWGITSEDPNLLWFSKQVIEATPVEMSDLLTLYIPPNVGAEGPSGNLTCGFPMDDKAILFKRSTINYFNGTGPDNTGANGQYSPPILITSTLGCSNPQSIVFMPNGLMFEFASEAGNQIWLLGRDLSTSYIGAPVESLTQNATVLSAVNLPGTNQVRFNMSSGITLMYDYFYQQWGTFTGNNGTPLMGSLVQSSTLFQGLHTLTTASGGIYQESPGKYLDGSSPVLMRFKTSWVNLGGIQGYQRAYFFYLLGRYLSPHKLLCSIAYDFNDSAEQASLISPNNFAPTYGSPAANGQTTPFGQDTPFGGPGDVEQWRVFLNKQRCSAFQLTIEELFDFNLGLTAGAGFTLSGLNLVLAVKKGFKPLAAANSIGG